MAPAPPFWRSLLFVPVTAERFVAKAPAVEADALILDLEDSIAPGEKTRARALLPDIASRLAHVGQQVLVRINRPWRQALPDLEAAVRSDVLGLLLPKVDSAAHVQAIAEVLDELEAERGLAAGHTRLLLLVESAAGYLRMAEIAAAHPRVLAMGLGSEDFSAALGMEPTSEFLLGPKQQMVITARAAGIHPLGLVGSIADYRDGEQLRRVALLSRQAGMDGASCIHPRQVQVCNEVFSPSAEEVAAARRIVEAYHHAHAQGVGAIVVEGRMVDVPVAKRAEEIVRRHEAIQAH